MGSAFVAAACGGELDRLCFLCSLALSLVGSDLGALIQVRLVGVGGIW